MPFHLVGNNKQINRAIINNCNKTIYKVKGKIIKEMYTLDDNIKATMPFLDTFIEINLSKLFNENCSSKIYDNKYYYTWINRKDIERIVNTIIFSEIERYIYMIGFHKSLEMYENFLNKKMDFDVLKTEQGIRKLYIGILLGVITIKNNEDIKKIKIKTLTHIDTKRKLYIIEDNIYNQDGSKCLEWE